jgi:hypothetical protein
MLEIPKHFPEFKQCRDQVFSLNNARVGDLAALSRVLLSPDQL